MTFKRAILAIIILMAALSRLLPHPPNFTPIMAMGLLGGVYFKNKQFAVIVPLLAMLVSDLVLGFHGTLIWVYSSIVVISLSASFLKPKMMNLGLASVGSSLFFFTVTNFAVWMTSAFYPKTLTGLGACYVAGLPFLQNAVVGDLVYVGILFGAFELAKRSIPQLSVDAA
ncbi:MAG: hypothetical protein H8E72_03385 [Candidatus Marinimicrobia bacterium]|nr:hypothetical protein [Candidatus Neomarinimicrobiota bacterium]